MIVLGEASIITPSFSLADGMEDTLLPRIVTSVL